MRVLREFLFVRFDALTLFSNGPTKPTAAAEEVLRQNGSEQLQRSPLTMNPDRPGVPRAYEALCAATANSRLCGTRRRTGPTRGGGSGPVPAARGLVVASSRGTTGTTPSHLAEAAVVGEEGQESASSVARLGTGPTPVQTKLEAPAEGPGPTTRLGQEGLGQEEATEVSWLVEIERADDQGVSSAEKKGIGPTPVRMKAAAAVPEEAARAPQLGEQPEQVEAMEVRQLLSSASQQLTARMLQVWRRRALGQ